MGEWINPAPVEIERELVPNVYGGYDSVPTSEGEVKNSRHLSEFRESLIAISLSRAAEMAMVEDEPYGFAAD